MALGGLLIGCVLGLLLGHWCWDAPLLAAMRRLPAQFSAAGREVSTAAISQFAPLFAMHVREAPLLF